MLETVIPTRTASKKTPARPTASATKAAAKTKSTKAAKSAKPVVKAAIKKPAKAAVAKSTKAATKPALKKAPVTGSAKTCSLITAALDTNKAEDVVVIDLANKCSFADYMIVASGRAGRHVSALADYVADALKKAGNPPLSVEGKDSSDWVLIDAGDVVVHIFRPEVRQFYNIEKMWALPPMPSV